jgi:HEAT repeats
LAWKPGYYANRVNLSKTSSLSVSVQEQVLVDLARWIARAQQYSASHPSCAALADETFQVLSRALGEGAPLEYTFARDDASVGGVPSVHPTVRARIAPFLHARGARLVRFVAGITKAELETLVDLLLPIPQKIVDGGGLAKIARERGVSRVEIEEVSGAIADDERLEHRRREELKRFFADASGALIAGRTADVDAETASELLERPEIAAAIIEEASRGGVAEGTASLALLARRHQWRKRSGEDAIREVLAVLSPEAKVRTLLGFPPLIGELRAALTWAFAALGEKELARFVLPALRASSAEPTAVLYALSLLVPRSGPRLSILRRVALHLYDVPDGEAPRVLGELGGPTPDFDSFRAEREILGEAARRAIASRGPLLALRSEAKDRAAAKADGGYGRVLTDLVGATAADADFPDVCAKLAAAASALAEEGELGATVGILRGLGGVGGEGEQHALQAIDAVVRPEAIPRLVTALDAAVENADERALAELGAVARCIARESPDAACAHVEETDNRKMRLLLLDALSSVGPSVVPLVRARLKSPKSDVVRSFLQLVGRAGGGARDVVGVVRHPDAKVRAEILRTLRTMPPDEITLDIVIGYVSDPSLDVRPGARAMLRGDRVVVGEAAVPRLERLARNADVDDDVRRAALEVLGRGTIDEAAEALYRFMQPEGLLEGSAVTALRDAAASALRESPSEAGKRLFALGLRSSVRRVRKACERAERGE